MVRKCVDKYIEVENVVGVTRLVEKHVDRLIDVEKLVEVPPVESRKLWKSLCWRTSPCVAKV